MTVNWPILLAFPDAFVLVAVTEPIDMDVKTTSHAERFNGSEKVIVPFDDTRSVAIGTVPASRTIVSTTPAEKVSAIAAGTTGVPSCPSVKLLL